MNFATIMTYAGLLVPFLTALNTLFLYFHWTKAAAIDQKVSAVLTSVGVTQPPAPPAA